MNSRRTLLVALCCLSALLLVLILALAFRQPADIPLRFWSVSFSPDSKMVVTAGGQGSPNEEPRLGELVFWDLNSRRKKRRYLQDSTIRSVVWSPDGKFVALGDFSGGTKLVNPQTARVIAGLPPHAGGANGSVNAVAVSGDGKLVAAGSADGTVTLWQPSGGELDPLVLLPGEKAFNIAISPDGRTLVAGGRKGNLYVFDLVQRGPPQVLPAYHGPPMSEPRVEAVAFAPDGHSFVTGCQHTLRLWETASARLIRDFVEGSSRINALAFSPKGDLLAAVDNDGQLTVWNPANGEFIKSAPAHNNESFGVAFSPDGLSIATVGRKDFTIKIWDAQTLAPVLRLYRSKPK
jgi:WD40 repeat protein